MQKKPWVVHRRYRDRKKELNQEWVKEQEEYEASKAWCDDWFMREVEKDEEDYNWDDFACCGECGSPIFSCQCLDGWNNYFQLERRF